MADPEVVAAMLAVAHDGLTIVPADVMARVTVDEFEAVHSILSTELELQGSDLRRSVAEFAQAVGDFLDAHPRWGL